MYKAEDNENENIANMVKAGINVQVPLIVRVREKDFTLNDYTFNVATCGCIRIKVGLHETLYSWHEFSLEICSYHIVMRYPALVFFASDDV